MCKNNNGSYQCLCYDGYTLGADEHSCEGNCKTTELTCIYISILCIVQISMNAIILMKDVSTIVPIQLAATIVHVLMVILLMTMVTTVHVRCSICC